MSPSWSVLSSWTGVELTLLQARALESHVVTPAATVHWTLRTVLERGQGPFGHQPGLGKTQEAGSVS